MGYWGFKRYARYVPAGETRALAARKLKQLRKIHPDIQPVVISGKSLASTWWGKAWNDNLERYADYQNRIERGRSYVRNGAVLDLRIDSGRVTALVQGTAGRPYDIDITIKPLDQSQLKAIREAVAGQLESAQELLAGQFPKALNDIFTAPRHGLFPSPSDITFACSCPDWARMCKHVAATLYGIGARLDQHPELFFTLRNIAMEDLIAQAIQATASKLLRASATKSTRVLEDTNLAALFGIDLADDASAVSTGSPQKTSFDSVGEPPIAPVGPISDVLPDVPPDMPIDRVRRVMCQAPAGVTVSTLLQQTGLEAFQVHNLLYIMKKRRQIQELAGGVLLLLNQLHQ